MSKKKFKKPKHKKTSPIAKAKEEITINQSDFLSFSLKYFQIKTPKFCFDNCNNHYYINLLERLKSLCSITITDFYNNRSASLRSHKIDWNDSSVTEKSFGLANEDQLVSVPYQFQISANEYGRVHGFIINNTFYIRWFDPEHNLYT